MDSNFLGAEGLFRPEAATNRRRARIEGDVIVARPLSFDLAAGVAGAMVIALGLYCFFGAYTPRISVMGQLVPEQGYAQVYPVQHGVVTEVLVYEGQAVRRGDVLFEVSAEQRVDTRSRGELASALSSEPKAESQQQTMAVVAPIDGVATTVQATIGQRVTMDVPLAVIIPSDVKLGAKLTVPSSAVEFIKNGGKVRLRYDVFPYQRFGTYAGTVARIYPTAIVHRESMASAVQQRTQAVDSTYQMMVDLDSQFVKVRGENQRLSVGMVVHADILQDKRPIYQWIFDPLSTLGERGVS